MKQPKTAGEWTLWILQYAWEVLIEILKFCLKFCAIVLRGANPKMFDTNYTYQQKKDYFDW